MQAKVTLPWEGMDTPYEGTLSTLDHSSKTARERRGKCKCNKTLPRGMRGHRYPRKPSTRDRRLVSVKHEASKPEVTRYAQLAGAQRDVD